MGNFFSDLFSGKDAKITTQSSVDASKKAVADPLSSFLANNIGSGVPRYGKDILTPLPEGGGASVNPFLKSTVDDVFGRIQDTANKTFKNNYSDLLEGSAGALSSSSRAYNDNTAITNLSLGLSGQRSALEQSLPGAQVDVATKVKAANDLEANAQYQDWMKSLPEYNPILDKALSFLSNQTSSGTTVLSALDPGKNAGIYDILKAAAQVGGAVAAAA